MPEKHKRELKDLQAGVNNMRYIAPKKPRLKMKERFFLQKNQNKKEEQMISKLVPDLLFFPSNICQIIAPKKVVDNKKN